jgi:Flp pilus assembly protein TadD
VRLDPRNPQFLSDLGWSLCQAGRLEEAEKVLSRAAAMDPSDRLARGNLRFCRARMSKLVRKKRDA